MKKGYTSSTPSMINSNSHGINTKTSSLQLGIRSTSNTDFQEWYSCQLNHHSSVFSSLPLIYHFSQPWNTAWDRKYTAVNTPISSSYVISRYYEYTSKSKFDQRQNGRKNTGVDISFLILQEFQLIKRELSVFAYTQRSFQIQIKRSSQVLPKLWANTSINSCDWYFAYAWRFYPILLSIT